MKQKQIFFSLAKSLLGPYFVLFPKKTRQKSKDQVLFTTYFNPTIHLQDLTHEDLEPKSRELQPMVLQAASYEIFVVYSETKVWSGSRSTRFEANMIDCPTLSFLAKMDPT